MALVCCRIIVNIPLVPCVSGSSIDRTFPRCMYIMQDGWLREYPVEVFINLAGLLGS